MTTWQEIGDGIWCRRYASLNLNIGVVRGADGLAVIDTRADGIQARELLTDIRELSRLRVRWVVNTHYHWDHTFGNAEFLPAPIWGHRRCAEALRSRGREMKADVAAWAPEIAARIDGVEIVPPDQIFEASTTVDLGNRRLHLRHHGRGHTDSDIVITVSDADAVFAGDLLEEGAPPYFGDGFPLEWATTLAALTPSVGSPVVPGHGAVVDGAFVDTQRHEIAEVARLARHHHASGTPVTEAAAAGGPFPEPTLADAYRRAYAQLDGTLP